MKFFQHLVLNVAQTSGLRMEKWQTGTSAPLSQQTVSSPPSALRSRSGFSVLEVMVAIAVLAMLMLMSTKLFDMISTTWRAQERQSDVFINARLALDFMAREMSAAMAAANDNRQAAPLTMWYKYGPTAPPYDAYSDQVYFVSPVALSAEATDLAEIGYYLRYESTNRTYQLLRRYTAYSNATCSGPPGGAPTITNPVVTNGCWNVWDSTYAAVSGWYNSPEPGLATVATTTPSTANNWNATTLASNIWSLQVQCYGKGSCEGTDNLPPGCSGASTIWDSSPSASGPGAMPQKLPRAVQITIKVYDQRTAARVRALPTLVVGTTTGSPNWKDVVGPNTHTFSTWVQIPNSSSNGP